MQTGSLYDDCYEHVAAEAHDPREVALAHEAGGAVADAAVAGAFMLMPEAESAIGALSSKAWEDTTTMTAHDLGVMYGPDVLTPIGSLVDFGGCVAVDSAEAAGETVVHGVVDGWQTYFESSAPAQADQGVANAIDPWAPTVDVWGPSAPTDVWAPGTGLEDGPSTAWGGMGGVDFNTGFDIGHDGGGHDGGGHDGGGGSPDGSF